MVIGNFNIRRTGGAFWPFEANTPLVVDADAVLAFPAALQGLEPVSRQNGKVLSVTADSSRSSFRRAARSMPEKALTRFPAAKAAVSLSGNDDHEDSIATNTPYVKRNVLMVACLT